MRRGAGVSRLDFVCVGAPKAGTTSLHAALSQHPDLFLPHGKEILFWPDDFSLDHWGHFVQKYYDHERIQKRLSRGDPIRIGWVNPRFWLDPRFPQKLHQIFPDVQILILLRNPLKRLISHYLEHLSLGDYLFDFQEFMKMAMDPVMRARARESHRFFIAGVPEYKPAYIFEASLYAEKVKAYRETFGPERVHVFILEEVAADSVSFLMEIQRILGLSRIRRLMFPRRHSRQETSVLRRNLAHLLERGANVLKRNGLTKRMVKAVLGRRIYDWLYWIKEHAQKHPADIRTSPSVAEIPEEARSLILEDVKRLEELLGRKLPW